MKLKLRHFIILQCLQEADEGVRAATVAQWTGKTLNAVYGPLCDLVKRGWVRREKIGERKADPVFYSLAKGARQSSDDPSEK